jgi:uncharacterized RDD family membrane protein YckC
MRCPKCHYLSFDPEPRCRNCGYSMALEPADLPLAAEVTGPDPPLDLALQTDAAVPREPLAAPTRPAGSSAVVRTPPAVERAAAGITPLTPRGPFDAPAAEPALGRDDAPPTQGIRAAAAPMPIWEDDLSIGPPELPTPTPQTPGRSATPEPTPRRPAVAPLTTELPLFVRGLAAEDDDGRAGRAILDAPLIVVPAEPRPPLAVRRTAAEPHARARATSSRKMGPLERDLLEDLQRLEQPDGESTSSADDRDDLAASDAAGSVPRLTAAVVDAGLLLGLGIGVVAVTLRWCDLTFAEIRLLPVLPTAAFLALVGLGYLLLFTAAGGQTIGKMLAGIRVASDDEQAGAPSVGQAVYREVIALPSVLALGAGFVPALMGDRRAFHDRVAGTRVVRA